MSSRTEPKFRLGGPMSFRSRTACTRECSIPWPDLGSTVSTGTASGKTLAFNLPVLNALAEEPKLRALYLYPTKALAQDQARALAAFKLPRLRPAIYDGDTETERRWQIRKWANVILTNPDMLH